MQIGEHSSSTARWNDVPRGTMDEVSSLCPLGPAVTSDGKAVTNRLFRLVLESHDGRCYGAAARILHPSLLM